ncbi:hypothetical protein JCM12294_03810 [Desulfocicer niacini]
MNNHKPSGNDHMDIQRIIITGPVQSGKSSLAWALVKKLRQASIPMAGFIAKGLWEDNRRCGFNLFDLKNQQTTPLAKRDQKATFPTSNKSMMAYRVPYTFLKEGIKAGKHALEPDNCRQAKIIMVDEMGKMELQAKGWACCIPPLLELKQCIHIWIVRETLVNSICSLWPFKTTKVISVHDPDALAKLMDICGIQP